MRLFHFSEESNIGVFEPKAVKRPTQRTPGKEWLNEPLVWSIDEWHQPMYLFPRECPRILFWPLSTTTPADRHAYCGENPPRMVAHIECDWLDRLHDTVLYRYELPVGTFESLDDAGMWISRASVTPIGVERIDDVPGALDDCGVALRVLPALGPLKDLWATSLHVSGIRLRNAQGWSA